MMERFHELESVTNKLEDKLSTTTLAGHDKRDPSSSDEDESQSARGTKPKKQKETLRGEKADLALHRGEFTRRNLVFHRPS